MQIESARLYSDLSWIWPYWEDVSDYREQMEKTVRLFEVHCDHQAKTVLDMGCGGGKSAYWLAKHFEVTGIDLSAAMLEHYKLLNPGSECFRADMRSFDLGLEFDGIFINDSINHMISPAELTSVFQQSFKHLRSGGVMIVVPENTKDNFYQNTTIVSQASSSLKPENLEITIIENSYDPNPADDIFETTLVYLIREKGKLRVEHETWGLGLFALKFWREALIETGFEVIESEMRLDNEFYPVFICKK